MNLTNIDEIYALLKRHGFRFSKSLGQNFLVASWVPEQIADSAELNKNTGVVEIGPGVGCLTEQLSMRAGRVVSIELDNALRPVLKETLLGRDNTEIVFADALKLDLNKLCEEKFPGMSCSVCANLPYNVTTPLLTAIIKADCFDTVTVMIQREVAKRICAPAGSEDYGAFGIFVQWYMDAELLFDVQPHCFVPQPKVTSSVIRLKRRAEKPAMVSDEALMFKIIRAAFNQRRKTLANAISSGISCPRETVQKAIENVGFDTKIRGEEVDIVGFAKISDEIGKLTALDL